jgi:hypothetical protein
VSIGEDLWTKMRDNVLWRKQARIIMALASALEVDEEKALDIFYSTETYRQLSDVKYGLQLMSDGYVLENVIAELKAKER